MISYADAEAKLQSEFDLWFVNRAEGYYRYYSTGFGGRLPTASKEMDPAIICHGDLGKLQSWFEKYARPLMAKLADAVKDVTCNASYSFSAENAYDFVAFTKDGNGAKTSGFNFHLRVAAPTSPRVEPQQAAVVTPNLGNKPVSKMTLSATAAAFVPSK